MFSELNQAYKSLLRQSGIRGLWKGIFPTLYRDVPFSAIYWMNYETIKKLLAENENIPPFWVSFVAGGISGSVSYCATNYTITSVY